MTQKVDVAAEVYWTPIDDPDCDFIPGHLTGVIREGNQLRLSFAGRSSKSGDEYEGIFTLELRSGSQTARGTQSYRELGGKWEPVPFSVT